MRISSARNPSKLIITAAIICLLSFVQIHAYSAVGSDSTVDILTWNIENFPKDGQNTIDEVRQIIADLDVDAIAVQEIGSVTDFEELVGQLPGWEGILSSHTYSDGTYQKLGLLYKSGVIQIDNYQLIFEGDTYAFPRPPMEFFITATESGNRFDFRMIIVHLKAQEGEDNEARRRSAIEQLKNYMDSEISTGDEKDFILLGDFNDHLEDPPQDNVFTVILNDSSDYTFLTKSLTGWQGSYIGYNEPNLIDHICLSSDALQEYGTCGTSQVVYLDNQNSSYEALVSDHRPVYAKFAFGQNIDAVTEIAQIHQNFSSYKQQMVTVEGVVTIGSGIFSPAYTSVYIQDQSDRGINIYKSDGLIGDFVQGNRVQISGQVIDYNGLHEIKYKDHQLISTGNDLPDSYPLPTGQIADVDAQPGRWVTVEGEILSISDPPHIKMMVDDGSGPGNIYFDPDAGLDVSSFMVGETIRVTGVKTVYNYEGEVQPGYQSDISKVEPSAVRSADTVPRAPVVIRNYPNPFNSSTIFQFYLDRPAHVSIQITDISGKMNQVLLPGRRPPGMQNIRFTPHGLASGVYFFNIFLEGRWLAGNSFVLIK